MPEPAEPMTTVPVRELGYITQYLHWALIAAHAVEHPDCSKVTVEIDIDRRVTTTSFTKRAEKPRGK